MATQTTNYGLQKPDYNDSADIGVINSNMDIIDAKMKEIDNKAESGGTSITVDKALSMTSTNPVQNKVITEALGATNENVNQLTTDMAYRDTMATDKTVSVSCEANKWTDLNTFTAPQSGVYLISVYAHTSLISNSALSAIGHAKYYSMMGSYGNNGKGFDCCSLHLNEGETVTSKIFCSSACTTDALIKISRL